jgi:hypothetical protein
MSENEGFLASNNIPEKNPDVTKRFWIFKEGD